MHQSFKIIIITFFLDSIISFAQTNDSIKIDQDYIKKLVQEEVQKELSKQKDEIRAENKKIFGDFLRFSGTGLLRAGEWDFKQNEINAATGNVKSLHNRYWTRFNFYLNIDSELTKGLDLHARIRTGQKQYSFVTFGENVDERFNITLDQFWLNWKFNKYELRAGRQDAGRIWSNQKGAQFDIPSHDGITAVANYNIKDITITPKAAFFIEYYRNNSSFKAQGKIYGASIKIAQTKNNLSWKAETGLIKAEQLPTRYLNDLAQNSSGIRYHDGDLAPAYSIWTNQIGLTFKELKNLSFTFDYYNNLKKYKENPISHTIYDINGKNSFNNPSEYNNSTAPNFTNQRQGFIGTVSVGNLSIPKNIWLAISYLHMEKYTAMDYFAQYDYTRWASTNIKGPEISAGYRLNKYIQFRSRFFASQEIKGLYAINPDYKKSEDRYRFDININF